MTPQELVRLPQTMVDIDGISRCHECACTIGVLPVPEMVVDHEQPAVCACSRCGAKAQTPPVLAIDALTRQVATLQTVWTQEQCDRRFEMHLAQFEEGVRDGIGKAPTTQAQFDAMVCLAYNIGVNAFQRSTVLRRHNAGDYAGAAAAFAMWNKGGGKVLKGLVRRRAAEAALYRSDSK